MPKFRVTKYDLKVKEPGSRNPNSVIPDLIRGPEKHKISSLLIGHKRRATKRFEIQLKHCYKQLSVASHGLNTCGKAVQSLGTMIVQSINLSTAWYNFFMQPVGNRVSYTGLQAQFFPAFTQCVLALFKLLTRLFSPLSTAPTRSDNKIYVLDFYYIQERGVCS